MSDSTTTAEDPQSLPVSPEPVPVTAAVDPLFVPVRFPGLNVSGVVVDRRESDMDVVLDTALVRTLPVGVQAIPIEDPDGQVALLRTVSRTLSQREAGARRETAGQAAAHAGVLERIRAYAIDRRRAGDICQSGLNDFLAEFDMVPDQVLVRFTISGSYRVNHGDQRAARNDAAGYLRVDLSQLDHVDEDSVDIEVTVDGVEPIDD